MRMRSIKPIKFVNIWKLRFCKFIDYSIRFILTVAITTLGSRIIEAEEGFPLKGLIVIGLILSALWLSLFSESILFKRIFPNQDGLEIILKTKKIKNKEERILVLEEATQLRNVSSIEKLWILKDIAELYKELGEENKTNEYYAKIEKETLEILDGKHIPIEQKIESIGQLAIQCFEQKEYKKSTRYYDKILEFNLEKYGIFFEKDILENMIEAYLIINQKQRAIQIYDSLLRQRRCKRNKAVEKMLQI